jgi:hypothetical protein
VTEQLAFELDVATADAVPRPFLEWQLICEIEERDEIAYERGEVGWLPSTEPDPEGLGRDVTKDRCNCCGRLRGSVEVEVDLPSGCVTVTEIPDPCLGWLPGLVGYACCGHGLRGRSVYIGALSGPAAARKMRELGGNPPAAAFLLDPVFGAGASS